MANKALVIDDDVATLELMRFQLEAEGFEVSTAEHAQKGLDLIKEIEFDIILTDLNLPDISGIEMVKRAKETLPETEIIMVTGFGSTEKAIEATKAGAFYYVEKPIEFEELIVLIEKAIDRKRSAAEIRELRGKLSNRHSYEGIIGASKAMQDIYEMIDGVAESDANILILGESGTGKEIIANAIHYKSTRAKKSFIKVNCSALPKELIESELFGHTRGAFTGATQDKIGYIGRANGGSLLLDEIGEMPIDLQPKLLRVLQDKVYYRVGSDKSQEVDFRLISATNRNPFDAIQDGSLREDLYYRINTIEIKIPPLRERMEDVPMLAEHFLQMYAEKYNRSAMSFSQKAFGQMLSYNWRGNVRELQHVVERAVLLSKGNIVQELSVPTSAEMNPSAVMSAPGNIVRQVSTAAFSGSQPGGAPESATDNSHFPANNLFNFTDEELFEEIGKFIVNKLPEPVDGQDQKDVFDSIEYGVVLAALKRTNGNKQAAANLLGLYRPRLYGMIKRHSLEEKI
ncbi:MAG TPA: sigma-54 dependent transcriptional regulator [Pyrinomonadaceae bacterium]|jgi:DNA-binding NtrC family response regulator